MAHACAQIEVANAEHSTERSQHFSMAVLAALAAEPACAALAPALLAHETQLVGLAAGGGHGAANAARALTALGR